MNRAARTSASGGRLLDVASELYGLRPTEFTQARNERARKLRADGDRDLARAVTALRKPSVAAWTVNMIVRHMAERVEDLLELGAQLRAAQDNLDATQLRELNKQRRQLTAA
ncbi:transposase, partial [Georgenia sp. 10Sc9-8]|nr:transposase [Georgenia halotolerans]